MAASIFSRGFRFNPSPEDAIAYYLPRLLAGGGKVLHEAVRPYIHAADVYGCEPDDLVRRFEPVPATDVRFFFTACKQCKKGSRAGPAGTGSTWHTGATLPVKDAAGVKIGECRKLRHKKNGAYTEWLMDEVSSCLHPQAVVGDTQFVFCKMYVSPRATTTTSSGSTTTRQDYAAAAAPSGVVVTQPPSQKIFAEPADPAAPAVLTQAATRPPATLTQPASTIFAAPAAPATVAQVAQHSSFPVPGRFQAAPAGVVVVKQTQPNSCFAVPAFTTQTAPKTFTAPVAPAAPPVFTTMQAAPKRPAPQVAMPPCPKRARDAYALPPTAAPVVQVQQQAPAGYNMMAPACTPLAAPRPPASSPAAAQPPVAVPTRPSVQPRRPCALLKTRPPVAAAQPPSCPAVQQGRPQTLSAPPRVRRCPPQVSVQTRKKQSVLDPFEVAEEDEEAVAAPADDQPPEEVPVTYGDDADDLVKMIEDTLEVIDEPPELALSRRQEGAEEKEEPAEPPSVEPSITFEEDIDYMQLVEDAIEAIDRSQAPAPDAATV
ncbi:hypothetical protein BS78_09G014800 [Paspalum vaginatum]|nr:hypothetical protein BS78_09G014800 [Paspalum vaginatum]